MLTGSLPDVIFICMILFFLKKSFLAGLVFVSGSEIFAKECVVLLHGLARSSASMKTLEKRLLAENYLVANINYPSTRHSIDELSELAVQQGIDQCQSSQAEKINFVTHSLGGILVRMYMNKHGLANAGRIVMLGPPNQGSEVVDRLKNMPGYEWINGPAGMQLGTGVTDIPRSLGAVNFELGVIAGTKSINLVLSSYLPDPDDGKVSVESAKVEGMKDFITVPVSHPFLMQRKQVIEQTVYFLKNGIFNKDI